MTDFEAVKFISTKILSDMNTTVSSRSVEYTFDELNEFLDSIRFSTCFIRPLQDILREIDETIVVDYVPQFDRNTASGLNDKTTKLRVSSNLMTLYDVVKAYNDEHGYSNEPDSMYETFIECISKRIVQEENESEHRWYDIRSVVHAVDIDGTERYFQTFDYHITGDNCASDMDLDMPTLDDVTEVHPHQVTMTVYK